MNRYYGNQIGKSIGREMDVDVDVVDMGWGSNLGVMVEISLGKTLAKGRFLSR